MLRIFILGDKLNPKWLILNKNSSDNPFALKIGRCLLDASIELRYKGLDMVAEDPQTCSVKVKSSLRHVSIEDP